MYRFDHAIIVVSDLQEAADGYRRLGFTVTPGGVHAGGRSHNALVILEDGTYFELFALTDPVLTGRLRTARAIGELTMLIDQQTAIDQRFFASVACGDGLADFAVVTGAMDEDVERLRGAGLVVDDPLANGRQRPDGAEIRWRLAITRLPLPFLIQDDTPRSLRVPEGDVAFHQNGAKKLLGMVVAVSDVAGAGRGYSALLGPGRADQTVVEGAGRTLDFDLSGVTITLAEPDGPASPLREHMAQRGEGPYRLSLFTEFVSEDGPLFTEETYGARIVLVSDAHH